jgi:hypothetical protein
MILLSFYYWSDIKLKLRKRKKCSYENMDVWNLKQFRVEISQCIRKRKARLSRTFYNFSEKILQVPFLSSQIAKEYIKKVYCLN